MDSLRSRWRRFVDRVLGSEAVPVDYGCDYCADDGNRLYGHVTQVADDERGFLLLNCPNCGALYEFNPGAYDGTRRVTETEARRLFPRWSARDGD